ncbi:MAG: glycosyltransferase, partial [Chloroflexi bacterium]|nr:glycosyltransferase [Chloroflexota bacterium]
MNILYITPYVPNLIRVRPYNLISILAQRGHNMTLATLWERADELQALEQLRTEGVRVIAAPLTRARRVWNNVRAVPTTQPLQATYCDAPALRRQIEAACHSQNGKFDVVHVEHLRGAAYGLWCKSRMQLRTNEQMSDSRIPVVWDSVDCITYLFEQAVRHSQSLFGR